MSDDTKICAVCNDLITGKLIQAEGKEFHHDCFTCHLCDLPLVFGSYSEIDGKRVCQSCRNQDRCEECGFIITGRSAMEVDGRLYHPDCFCCVECGENLKKFFEKDGQFYCQECLSRKFDGVCYKCSGALPARFTKACGKSWHDECFKCAHCNRLFGDDPFVNINGEPWCDDCEANYDNIQEKKIAANQAAALQKAAALGSKDSAAPRASGPAAGGATAAPAPAHPPPARAAPLSTKGASTTSVGAGAGASASVGSKPSAPAAAAKPAAARPVSQAPPAKVVGGPKQASSAQTSGYQRVGKSEEWNDLDDFAFMNTK